MHTPRNLLALALLVSLTVSACGGNDPEPTPTLSVELIQTFAVATFASGLTQTAISNPTATSTITPFPTLAPAATSTAGTPFGPAGGLNPTASCYRLVYVQDVTIPDNTSMTPSQVFTKTWRVQNSGSCAWQAGFKFSLVGGEAMGGATLTLQQSVNPGAQYDLSIPMAAPTNKTGAVTGTWRMSDGNGAFFGDALTVVIVIGAGNTSPPATPTETPTPTP